MAVIRSWAGDGLSAGAASTGSVGAGDNAFTTVGAGINITTDGPRSPRLTWPSGSSNVNTRWNGLGGLTAWALRVYVEFDNLPSAAYGLLGGYNSGGTERWRLECSGSNVPRLRNSDTETFTWTAPGGLSADQQYRVELTGTDDGSCTVYIYEGESETPLYTGSATIPAEALYEVRWGQVAGSAAAERKMDDFAIGDTADLLGAVDPDEPEPPYEGVIREWSGDGLSAGAMTTATVGDDDNAFTTVTSGMTISATGTRSPRVAWPASSGAHQVRWNNLGQLETWAVRRYFEHTTLPSNTWHLMTGLDIIGQEQWRVEFSAAGLLRLRNASGATYSATTEPLEAGVSYRCEVVGDSTDGTATVYLYRGDYTTARLSGTGTIGTSPLDEVRFGHYTSHATPAEFGDDFAIANTDALIGPKVDAGPEPAPPTTRSWSGDGLSAGTLTTSTAGAGDSTFNSVTSGLTVAEVGKRSPGIALTNTAQAKRFGWWPLAESALTSYAIRWYVQMSGMPGGEVYLASGLDDGGNSWSIRLLTDGRLRIRDDNAATVRWTASAGNAIPLDTAIRCELVVDNGAATLTAYRSDYDTVIASGTGALTLGINEVRFGSTQVVATTGVIYDDLAFSSEAEEIGPAGEPLPPVTAFLRTPEDTWAPMEVVVL